MANGGAPAQDWRAGTTWQRYPIEDYPDRFFSRILSSPCIPASYVQSSQSEQALAPATLSFRKLVLRVGHMTDYPDAALWAMLDFAVAKGQESVVLPW